MSDDSFYILGALLGSGSSPTRNNDSRPRYREVDPPSAASAHETSFFTGCEKQGVTLEVLARYLNLARSGQINQIPPQHRTPEIFNTKFQGQFSAKIDRYSIVYAAAVSGHIDQVPANCFTEHGIISSNEIRGQDYAAMDALMDKKQLSKIPSELITERTLNGYVTTVSGYRLSRLALAVNTGMFGQIPQRCFTRETLAWENKSPDGKYHSKVMHIIAEHGLLNKIDKSLVNEETLSWKDAYGNSVLAYAVFFGHLPQIDKSLINERTLSLEDNDGDTILHVVAEKKQWAHMPMEKVTKGLLLKKNKKGIRVVDSIIKAEGGIAPKWLLAIIPDADKPVPPATPPALPVVVRAVPQKVVGPVAPKVVAKAVAPKVAPKTSRRFSQTPLTARILRGTVWTAAGVGVLLLMKQCHEERLSQQNESKPAVVSDPGM